MKLPNGGEAIVDIAKLRDYGLSPEHEEGKHKARVFAAALGIFRNDAAWLRERLIEAAGRENAILVSETVFGRLFVLDFAVKTPVGEALIRSGSDNPASGECPTFNDLLCEAE